MRGASACPFRNAIKQEAQWKDLEVAKGGYTCVKSREQSGFLGDDSPGQSRQGVRSGFWLMTPPVRAE